MQQGSLIAMNSRPSQSDIEFSMRKNIPIPIMGEIYTCSGIGKSMKGKTTLGIEELRSDITTYYASAFYEVQPPMDVEELVEECCCVPVER